jgi:hypothetical protein
MILEKGLFVSSVLKINNSYKIKKKANNLNIPHRDTVRPLNGLPYPHCAPVHIKPYNITN